MQPRKVKLIRLGKISPCLQCCGQRSSWGPSPTGQSTYSKYSVLKYISNAHYKIKKSWISFSHLLFIDVAEIVHLQSPAGHGAAGGGPQGLDQAHVVLLAWKVRYRNIYVNKNIYFSWNSPYPAGGGWGWPRCKGRPSKNIYFFYLCKGKLSYRKLLSHLSEVDELNVVEDEVVDGEAVVAAHHDEDVEVCIF